MGSLMLNLYSIYRLNEVESRVQYIGSIHSVSRDIDRLYSMINQVFKENKWVVEQEYKPNTEKSSPQEIHLDIEWTFKEVEVDAFVSLLYRAKDEAEWKEVAAQNKGLGTFAAPVILSPKERYEYQVIARGSTLRTGDIHQIPEEFYRITPLRPFAGFEGTVDGNKIKFLLQFLPPLYDFYKPIKVIAIVHRHDQV